MPTALSNIRVLDLTRMVAGPFGTLLLSDLGAEVIKVERPGHGDEVRTMGPHFLSGESVYFMSINRGKKSVCVDLGRAEGKQVLRDLALRCDVVIDNFRYGVAERLGCDYPTLSAINPRLIACGITAFGRNGPDRDQPAFDLTLQARGGTMGITGEPGGSPVRMGPPMGDLAGGMYAAMAICAALYERERTGRGQFIDMSLLDCQVALLTYSAAFYLNAGDVMGPQGSAHAHAIPYQTFATRDVPLAVAVFTDAFWPGFCRAVGISAWENDPGLATALQRRQRKDEVLSVVAERLREQSVDHWLAALRREGVPCAPVQSIDRVFSDPQVLARGMLAHTQHPSAGTVRVAGNPIKMGEPVQTEVLAAAPLLGEHTDQVLQALCGYEPERIAWLREHGVIGH
jgi:crotonobetainyl-CoA:carnitine CoA-transferase CaiB-like acyl-CoA transferase